MFEVIRNGYNYSKTWPLKPQLYTIFPECRIIKATQFATLVLPIIALVTFFTQYSYFGPSFIPQSLALCCLILSLPIQGYIWLGKRAKQVLPASLANWYYQLEDKLIEQGIELKGTGHKPTYQDMGYALGEAYKKLDKTWLNEWL